MIYNELLFCVLLLAMAFLYSSVGHGGASGYLAIMAIFSYPPNSMRSIALLLNTLVSFIAFIQYYRAGYFRWNLFWPFVLTSVPAAFLGGLINLDENIYKPLLAIFLVVSAFKLLSHKVQLKQSFKEINIIWAFILGAGIGFFSGMLGIGGGIILSPVILFLHWANMKQTAAISALFIFSNSLSGLAGLHVKGFGFDSEMLILGVVVFFGGLLGSYLGARKIENEILKTMLAIILFVASMKLIFT
ncbi:MAG: sulfite exporter TauE/SafE family protein [Saprospiraceae bacterium]